MPTLPVIITIVSLIPLLLLMLVGTISVGQYFWHQEQIFRRIIVGAIIYYIGLGVYWLFASGILQVGL